jgi:cyclopropane fatty-acyl-phospholipid synthase-like methyltransferase
MRTHHDAHEDRPVGRGNRQESQYAFPYHHVPARTSAGFQQTLVVRWGYVYLSYLEFVLALLARDPFESLLDIGCGDGRLVREVSTRFPRTRVTGVDSSSRAIGLARAMAPEAEFVAGDIAASDIAPGPFEIATLIEVLEHVPPEKTPRFAKAISQRLSPQGRLIVTVPTPVSGAQSKHYRHFDQERLEDALSPAFSMRETFFLNRRSRVVRILDRLLTNRFFAVRHPGLLGRILELYTRHWLASPPRLATRICAVFQRSD